MLRGKEPGRDEPMYLNTSFEIVDIVNEHIAVPIGEKAASFGGVVALTEAACFLMKNLSGPKTKEELVELLIAEYDLERSDAERDIEKFIQSSLELGLVEEQAQSSAFVYG